jgi:predicted RNase H-like HicB family nuclease
VIDMLERHDGVPPGKHPQTLREFLSIPYVLESKAIEGEDGTRVRCVSYPELPGCFAQAISIEDAIRLLERHRIEMIVRMLREGRSPPCPRQPLPGCDPEWIAAEAGVASNIRHLLDLPGGELRNVPDPFAQMRDEQDIAGEKG